MKRRTFFKTTALSGSALAVTGLAGCQTATQKNESQPDFSNFELNELTVDDLQQKMQSGELTAESICQKYLARIEQVDPVLKAVMELNPDALKIARDLDEERKN
ncbi:MAG: hypothetical protein LC658_14230, partial [Bacteroidales bacterium]|nr:hypothetical protein [Bacteroidales bacterium]